MAWVEASGSGHRVVDRRDGKRAAGPVLPSAAEAVRWAVANGWMEGPEQALTELVRQYAEARLADEAPITDAFAVVLQHSLASLFTKRKWVRATDVTLQAIDEWRRETKGKGVPRLLAYLLAVLRWAHYHLDVPVDTKVLTLRRPRKVRSVKAAELLTDEHVHKVMREAGRFGAHVDALVHYLAVYGARPVTACKLTVGNVHFATGELVVRAKHSGQWRHHLRRDTLGLFAAICEGRDADAPLFLSNPTRADDGRPLERRADGGWKLDGHCGAASLSRWYVRNLGDPFLPAALSRIYHLKRFAITSMLRNGMNPALVATITGHLSLSQVMEYARTSSTDSANTLSMLPAAPAHRIAHSSPQQKSRKSRTPR